MTDGTTPAPARPLTFAEIKAKARLRESEAVVCLAGDLAADAERLAREIAAIKEQNRVATSMDDEDDGERARLESELDELRQLMRADEVILRFRAIPPEDYANLVAAHPSDDPEKAFDETTFEPALVSACSLQPRMTVAEVGELYKLLNHHSRALVWSAVYRANHNAVSIPS